MTVNFLPVAAAELQDAVDWYNRQHPGLGERFRTEVGRTIERILIFPEGWTRVSRRSRRCLTRKFPYGLIYQVRPNSILIVAKGGVLEGSNRRVNDHPALSIAARIFSTPVFSTSSASRFQYSLLNSSSDRAVVPPVPFSSFRMSAIGAMPSPG